MSDWYVKELGLPGIDVDAAGSGFRLVTRSRHYDGPNLARVGQGIQQVLPVATYLLGLAHNYIQHKLLIIEEPELHLHPSAHGGLSDMAIAAAAASPSVQLIMETHSENLLLRLRRRVADGTLAPADVNFLWFEQTHQQYSEVIEIEVREDGSVTHWPKGVFAEDLAEVRAIAQATQS